MEEDYFKEYLATANAISNLASLALTAVREENHSEAVMLFSLIGKFSNAAMVTASVHSSNQLKKEVIPEEFLTEEDTGVTHPLDPGQYL